MEYGMTEQRAREMFAKGQAYNGAACELMNDMTENGYDPDDMTAARAGVRSAENRASDLGTVGTFYRIGAPRVCEWTNTYFPSHNYANDRQESGVSVITLDWLHSLKSTFFGMDTDKIKARGVYKLRGMIVGHGGDDEPVILPLGWAEKTSIRSRAALVKAIGENM